jgi:hypothetical protein
VKGRELLRPIETVPVPASVERKAGTTAVAVVFETVVFAVVMIVELTPWLAGFDQSTWAGVPTGPNRLPVKVTVVPAHPSLGLTELRSQAEAAWALRKSPARLRVEARRAVRMSARGEIWRPGEIGSPKRVRALCPHRLFTAPLCPFVRAIQPFTRCQGGALKPSSPPSEGPTAHQLASQGSKALKGCQRSRARRLEGWR